MKQFGIILLSSLLFLVGSSSMAYEEGVHKIAKDHKVYYKYEKAEKGKPTIVLLNGLIYAIKNWDEYFDILAKQGFGVLQIAYSTQPESLATLEGVEPYYQKIIATTQGPKQIGITTQDLVDEVMSVIDDLDIDKFHLLSLSYSSVVGSELAVQQRDRIITNIFASPAVLASHRYNAWGKARHAWYESVGPAGDYYYDLELQSSMYTLVAAGGYHFDDVDFDTFFYGVFQMGRSAKYFDLKDYTDKDLPPTHLFLASREDGSLLEDQLRFWELMKDNPARGSFTMFEGGEHALPGVVPKAAAEMTAK
ncbi:MAG: alpha/beta hydrolase, partial [Bdellovibrionales bacterium]|nr:alpha/beta hydrolase [Bdellovibrionales bacterium]